MLLSITFGLYANAQYIVNQGGDITISSGSTLYIDGDFTNQLDGSIDNSGSILITGDWTNNQTSGNLLLSTSGTVSFMGSAVQGIGGSAPTYFNNLNLNNDAILNGTSSISVSSSLTLSSTFLSSSNSLLKR